MARIGYGRVSTHDQHSRAQLDALLAAGCDPELMVSRYGGSLWSVPSKVR